jgi:drug/metabolite transporter (DMT)-like permease
MPGHFFKRKTQGISMSTNAGNRVEATQSKELPLRAALFSLFLNFLFGANAVAAKISLMGMGVFTTVGLRFFLAAIAISFWAIITGQPLSIDRIKAKQLIILSIFFVAQIGLFYLGLNMTTASRGTLIGNLLPFVVLLLAHFFIPGDTITGRKVIGILLGFCGILFVVLDKEGVTVDVKTGDLLIFFAVIIWGMSAIYVKKLTATIHPLIISLYPMFLAAPCFLLVGFFWDDGMVRFIDMSIVISLLYQSFVTASFCYIAWNTMIKKYGATALHSFVFVMPVSGVFFGVVLLGEPFTPHILASISLIAAGIIVINSKKKII